MSKIIHWLTEYERIVKVERLEKALPNGEIYQIHFERKKPFTTKIETDLYVGDGHYTGWRKLSSGEKPGIGLNALLQDAWEAWHWSGQFCEPLRRGK